MRRSPSLGNQNPLAIDAGTLRHKVQIQAQSMVGDADTGEPSATWSDVLAAFARIDAVSSRQIFQSGQGLQFVSQVTHLVTIRWPGFSVGISGGMRVLFGIRIFQVQIVENVQERNRILKLLCLEINGGNSNCS
jgi:SPP1 family predicted phage head-tail adaptor